MAALTPINITLHCADATPLPLNFALQCRVSATTTVAQLLNGLDRATKLYLKTHIKVQHTNSFYAIDSSALFTEAQIVDGTTISI